MVVYINKTRRNRKLLGIHVASSANFSLPNLIRTPECKKLASGTKAGRLGGSRPRVASIYTVIEKGNMWRAKVVWTSLHVDHHPHMSRNLRVLCSKNVLLRGRPSPVPATVVVDKSTGTTIEIHEGIASRSEYPVVADSDWIDVGDHWILPGLVE